MQFDTYCFFADRLATHFDGDLVSVLLAPRPFDNKGGLAVVFSDDAGPYRQLRRGIRLCNPPEGELRCVRQSELFLLSVPRFSPQGPSSYPLWTCYLRHRGHVLHGEDLRERIPEPVGVEQALESSLDCRSCWVRGHLLLKHLYQETYEELVFTLDALFRELMGLALLRVHGVWDVRYDTLPEHFTREIPDSELSACWEAFDAVARALDEMDEGAQRQSAYEAVWQFERFMRLLRRYA